MMYYNCCSLHEVLGDRWWPLFRIRECTRYGLLVQCADKRWCPELASNCPCSRGSTSYWLALCSRTAPGRRPPAARSAPQRKLLLPSRSRRSVGLHLQWHYAKPNSTPQTLRQCATACCGTNVGTKQFMQVDAIWCNLHINLQIGWQRQ